MCNNCNCACKGEPGPRGVQGPMGPMGPLGLGYYVVKIPLTSSQILNSYTTPILAISAPGSLFAINVIGGSMRLDFNSIAYSGNVLLSLITDTASLYQGTFYALNSTVTRWSRFNNTPGINATDTQLIAGKGLYIKNLVGNASVGNSPATVYIIYQLVEM